MNYSYYVGKILKYTMNVFYESSQSSNIDEQFRFGVIKYSLKANIVSNLKSYPGLYELYAEIKKLTFNGRQSDLRVALNIVKNKVNLSSNIFQCYVLSSMKLFFAFKPLSCRHVILQNIRD